MGPESSGWGLLGHILSASFCYVFMFLLLSHMFCSFLFFFGQIVTLFTFLSGGTFVARRCWCILYWFCGFLGVIDSGCSLFWGTESGL